MLNVFRNLIKFGKGNPKSSLSAQQACDIAEKAVVGSHCAGVMNLSRLDNNDGKLVWSVSSVTIGSGITVTIDDATAVVINKERWGVR